MKYLILSLIALFFLGCEQDSTQRKETTLRHNVDRLEQGDNVDQTIEQISQDTAELNLVKIKAISQSRIITSIEAFEFKTSLSHLSFDDIYIDQLEHFKSLALPQLGSVELDDVTRKLLIKELGKMPSSQKVSLEYFVEFDSESLKQLGQLEKLVFSVSLNDGFKNHFYQGQLRYDNLMDKDVKSEGVYWANAKLIFSDIDSEMLLKNTLLNRPQFISLFDYSDKNGASFQDQITQFNKQHVWVTVVHPKYTKTFIVKPQANQELLLKSIASDIDFDDVYGVRYFDGVESSEVSKWRIYSKRFMTPKESLEAQDQIVIAYCKQEQSFQQISTYQVSIKSVHESEQFAGNGETFLFLLDGLKEISIPVCNEKKISDWDVTKECVKSAPVCVKSEPVCKAQKKTCEVYKPCNLLDIENGKCDPGTPVCLKFKSECVKFESECKQYGTKCIQEKELPINVSSCKVNYNVLQKNTLKNLTLSEELEFSYLELDAANSEPDFVVLNSALGGGEISLKNKSVNEFKIGYISDDCRKNHEPFSQQFTSVFEETNVNLRLNIWRVLHE